MYIAFHGNLESIQQHIMNIKALKPKNVAYLKEFFPSFKEASADPKKQMLQFLMLRNDFYKANLEGNTIPYIISAGSIFSYYSRIFSQDQTLLDKARNVARMLGINREPDLVIYLRDRDKAKRNPLRDYFYRHLGSWYGINLKIVNRRDFVTDKKRIVKTILEEMHNEHV